MKKYIEIILLVFIIAFAYLFVLSEKNLWTFLLIVFSVLFTIFSLFRIFQKVDIAKTVVELLLVWYVVIVLFFSANASFWLSFIAVIIGIISVIRMMSIRHDKNQSEE